MPAAAVPPPPPACEHLQLAGDGRIARITLNRPQQLNALSPALLHELIAVSAWLAAQPQLRIVLLHGAGRAFCAGFDLDAMRSTGSALDRETADLGRRMAQAWAAIPAITIACVHGHCVGGGVVLAGVCDLRLAADDARFSIPELALGIPLGWGGVPLLLRLVGPAVAMELVLDCRPFDAAQALAWRMVNRVVPATALMAEGQAWAERLAGLPLQALRATKQRFAQAAEALSPAAGSEVDADALLAAFHDPESQALQQRYMRARGRG